VVDRIGFLVVVLSLYVHEKGKRAVRESTRV